MQGEVFVDAAQAGNEVIFERADGTFGSVASMHAGGYQLEVDTFVDEKGFEGSRAFVVQSMKLGAEPRRNEARVQRLESGENARAGAAFHWFN